MTDFPSWAKVGTKVVCVDDTVGAYRVPGVNYVGGLNGLTAGDVYTIRSTHISYYTGELNVRLLEIRRSILSGEPYEVGFNFNRFRPLTSTKTEAEDLAYFKQFLQSSIETSHWKQEERME